MGRTGSGASAGTSAATTDARRRISASYGERPPGWRLLALKLERTSRAAERDAALVCARRSGGRALVGLLLLQAATTSLTAWWSSSELRCKRSRLSRRARTTACSTGFGSLDIAVPPRGTGSLP